jgi:ABC-type uncharacterized transport system substrate-binding protein
MNWNLRFAALLLLAVLCFSKNVQATHRVLWIDSYHQGYAWSDSLEEAITTTLKGHDVTLKIHRMDTKLNKSDAFKKAAAKKAYEVINAYKPHIVIASDDNASKYLVMPFLKNASLPVIFCGVNNNATKYGYPYQNATGIIELDPIEKLFYTMTFFSRIEKAGYLAGDTTTAHINGDLYEKRIRVRLLGRYVNTFSEWRSAFLELQQQCDMLIVGNVSAIKDWDDAKAKQFVINRTKVPTGCVLEFLTPYAMIGYLKLPEEQGRWAAQTALKVLDGAQIDSIPVRRPNEGRLILNKKIADAVNVRFPKSFLKQADRIIK